MSHDMNDTQTDPSSLPWLGRKLLWLDDMKNVDRIVYALIGLCALLALADFAYHKHSYFAMEDIPGFYAAYGFFLPIALVICAKVMRVLLAREEDYYAPKDVESEPFPEDQLDRESHNA